ncbi:Geranylgeranyl pyrophosphate synthase [Corynebacterium pseudotuberculosis]|uniref:polyprenyl synthetase family protein n=1 Tax=Corynebacterium pseudotuberculosis TaxID=1719 RepID=UPI00065E2B98|nr:polyprenyl synthetase family protein [Corynebacterium pseudotuberculosis]AKP09070.1 Geranylgeranyl pyrophosphate synthase [Corynebacterium pseudotuberculosis]
MHHPFPDAHTASPAREKDSATVSRSATPTQFDARSLTFSEIEPAVEHKLRAFFQGRARKISVIGEPVSRVVTYLEDFVLGGGKRIRPSYAWAGFLAGNGLEGTEDPEAVLASISSLELIQACALIHDDIIDASDSRRGQPTVHRSAEACHRDNSWNGDSTHFGESIAILLGDLAFAWADDMFRTSGLSDAAIARTSNAWRGMRTEVIGGQLLDVFLESAGSESIELAENVNRFKTAAYTIERPLHIGAAIAGADERIVHALRDYGRDIGVAYQLRDDLLGVFGDPAVTGKPAGDDLREGKRTVLVAKALELAHAADNADAVESIRKGVGRVTDPHDIACLADTIRKTGAEAGVEKRIDELAERGISHLSTADISEGARSVLVSLAHKATARSM